MNFFDEDLKNTDNEYYFNVLVTTIAINQNCTNRYLDSGINEITYIEKITSPKPQIVYCFVDNELDKDLEYEILNFPHCVVEVDAEKGIYWWNMIDFDTDDPWRIDLDEEDCY